MPSPLSLRIARDWSKPGIERVRLAPIDRQWHEAGRATLEAVVRYLVRRGWHRRHTSKARWVQRADSRYLQAPNRPTYEIRVSNHALPASGRYHGQHQYIITRGVMTNYTVLGIITWIEADLARSNARRKRRPKASEVGIGVF